MPQASIEGNGITTAPVNGETQNDHSTHNAEDPQPLKVVIVGAGIGGLTAAIALRKQGHHVTLLEQRSEANETGAAIHLPPNTNGVLRRLGLDAERFGANECSQLTEYSSDGKKFLDLDLSKMAGMWQHKWLLCHRAQLHQNLSKVAVSEDAPGPPATIHYSSSITSVTPSTATVTLTTGERVQGDVLLGADGVSSLTRRSIAPDAKPHSSGKSAFRFLITRAAALSDEATAPFAQRNSEMTIWFANDRRVVMYPCDHNKHLNFVCIHPASESASSTDDWNEGGNKDRLLDVYAGWNEDVRALLRKADPSTLKVWGLLDMDVLPTWVNERLALLGDAAHPFLPYQGQGGGQAIEDAMSVACMLPRGTAAADVPERLRLYEKARYGRAHRIQEYTRIAGLDADSEKKVDMQQYTAYNFGHDEFDHSSQVFEEHCLSKTPDAALRMPLGFGPPPSLQRVGGGGGATFTTATVKFKTSRTYLQRLFPNTQFSYKSPATVAVATLAQTTTDGLEALGGGGSKTLGLYLHGVAYTKGDGSVVMGTYLPLVFESSAETAMARREVQGVPSVCCDVNVRRRGRGYGVRASWRGATFGFVDFEGLEEEKDAAKVAQETGTPGEDKDAGVVTWKYVPSTGKAEKADAAYAVITPREEKKEETQALRKVKRVWRTRTASLRFDKLREVDLPTLKHVVGKLEEMPVYEVLEAKVVEGRGVLEGGGARRVE